MSWSHYPNSLLPSLMQKCTCNSLHLAFDLCGGEA
nr:hypothetical protein [Escherichia coli]